MYLTLVSATLFGRCFQLLSLAISRYGLTFHLFGTAGKPGYALWAFLGVSWEWRLWYGDKGQRVLIQFCWREVIRWQTWKDREGAKRCC